MALNIVWPWFSHWASKNFYSFRFVVFVLYFSPKENTSVIVMWASFYAALKRPQASEDGLHYGQEIISLVIIFTVIWQSLKTLWSLLRSSTMRFIWNRISLWINVTVFWNDYKNSKEWHSLFNIYFIKMRKQDYFIHLFIAMIWDNGA